MILVDTSIWIDFFRYIPAVFTPLCLRIESFQVLAAEWVFGELLQGAKNKAELEFIVTYWQYLPKCDTGEIWMQAGRYAQEHKLVSKGVGLIDAAIIVSAKRHKAKIWTLDKKLLNVLSPHEIFSL